MSNAVPVSQVTKIESCPRCGGQLSRSRTRHGQPVKICTGCGGTLVKLGALEKTFAKESLNEMLVQARQHAQAGSICPHCAVPMSILLVSTGKQNVEIDLCDKCQSVWFDKNEFELLAPGDGVLMPSISAGKAYRRELVMTLTADLHSGRLKPAHIGILKAILKKEYCVPKPDITPVIGTLQAQRIISIQPDGTINILPRQE